MTTASFGGTRLITERPVLTTIKVMMCSAAIWSAAIVPPAIALGSDFPAPYNSEPIELGPQPPGAAASGFESLAGLRASVFASEPDVQNPIAMAWDKDGRLWVAENYTYAERSQRFDLSLRDRVVVLSDLDRDGVADFREVFTDDVQMLTSVAVADDGVWLMCPPALMFVPHADRHRRPDGPPVVRLDGFTVAAENYHNFANGLKWGPDGWLYGRCGGSCPGRVGVPGTPDDHRVALEGGLWRFDPDSNRFEVLCHGTTNPWGHDWNADQQAFFINTVNGHLWHAIPGAHYKRPFTLDPNPYVYELIDQHADHYHFDTGRAWHESRDGKAGDYGGGHAHSGMAILDDRRLPDLWQGRLATWNFHGRRLNTEHLDRHGAGYVATHGSDRLLASDDFFRGMEVCVGPDGALYGADWSDTGECHEHTGVHRTSGRIYRFAGEKADRSPMTQPRSESLATTSEEGAAAIAINQLVADWPIDDVFGPVWIAESHRAIIATEAAERLPRLVTTAKSDRRGLVQLALASAIQRLPVHLRSELAAAISSRDDYADDHNLPLLVWYGLIPVADEAPEQLASFIEQTAWDRTRRLAVRRLAAEIERSPEVVDQVVAFASSAPPNVRKSVIRGLQQGFRGWSSAAQPPHWEQLVTATAGDPDVADAMRELSLLFGDGATLEAIEALIVDEATSIGVRSSALKALVSKSDGPAVERICLSVLGDARLNATAAEGLAKSQDPRVTEAFIKNYRRFRSPQRPRVIAILASRPKSSLSLLAAIEQGKIPKADLTAYDARQMVQHGQEVAERVKSTWGNVATTEREQAAKIDDLKDKLDPGTLMTADRSRGRAVFAASCAKCHQLFGRGEQIGPDLTGANRSNLDYLTENIVAPSAVVSTNYRLSLLRMEDGRTLSGLVTNQTDRTVTLQAQTELLVLPREEIDQIKQTELSPMPAGLLDNLDDRAVVDLFGYLMSPVQVPLPSE